MSLISTIGGLAAVAFPGAGTAIGIVTKIADAAYENREAIKAIIENSGPVIDAGKLAFDALQKAAPAVLPAVEDLAKHLLPSFSGKSLEDVKHAVASHVVGELVPGWTNEEANRWMNLQNATG